MNTTTSRPQREHSVPWFWPLAAAAEIEAEGLKLFRDNLRFAAELETVEAPPPPEWASPNRIMLDTDTMRLRDFPADGGTPGAMPVLVDAPYAGHSAVIADYAPGQSLVETLGAAVPGRVLVTDWKGATHAMRDFGIDRYLRDLDRAVEALGGRVALVGLCQGGWLSAIYTALNPEKVAALVLAGSPIDTDAGDGALEHIAHDTPMAFYEEMVTAGGGLMPGRFMLAGWKSMHPGEQYLGKFLDLYAHIEDDGFIARTERFERWYENPLDLPGRFYLQAIRWLFKENRLAKGRFVALGRPVSLHAIACPLFLLAGEADDITPAPQVFAAATLVATPPERIEQRAVPGGHIGLFMGRRTLRDTWPDVGAWLARQTAA